MLCFFHSSHRTNCSANSRSNASACNLPKTLLFWLNPFLASIALFFTTFHVPNVFAGAIGSNWVVVVNGQSINSRTIANHYCSARNIPGRNVSFFPKFQTRTRFQLTSFANSFWGQSLRKSKREVSQPIFRESLTPPISQLQLPSVPKSTLSQISRPT